MQLHRSLPSRDLRHREGQKLAKEYMCSFTKACLRLSSDTENRLRIGTRDMPIRAREKSQLQRTSVIPPRGLTLERLSEELQTKPLQHKKP